MRQTAKLLKQEGLISSEHVFVIVSKLIGAERQLQAGEYRLHTQMSPWGILDVLKTGRVLLHEVTVPEGLNIRQTARLLSERELVSYQEFMRLVHDPSFIRSLGIQKDSLEGYLYPQTYSFTKRLGSDRIIRAMVTMFQQVYTADLDERAQALSMTRQEVVTLASIIEKEASLEHERPLISAVFHNRLKRQIPLQSDPTVIYVLPNFDGNLRRKDLRVRSPYNTYEVKGLPPGPITNPGRESLLAALYPAPVNYLYFVSKNDGTHHFSKTLSEHNKAVWRYQKRRVRAKRSNPQDGS